MSAPKKRSFKTASAREIGKEFKASIAPLMEPDALKDAMCTAYFAALASDFSDEQFIAFLRSFADDIERNSAPAHSGNRRKGSQNDDPAVASKHR